MTRPQLDRATTVTTPTDREIVIERSFDASRSLVFRAFTEAEHLPRWLGRRDWPMTTCDVDLRVGGSYRYVFTDADGQTMGMGGTFTEIVAPELVVTTEQFDDYPGPTVNTAVFVERDGRTTMTLTVAYPSTEIRDGWLASGIADGMNEGFGRLDDLLTGMA